MTDEACAAIIGIGAAMFALWMAVDRRRPDQAQKRASGADEGFAQ